MSADAADSGLSFWIIAVLGVFVVIVDPQNLMSGLLGLWAACLDMDQPAGSYGEDHR
ncbi:hypothetical protein GGR11_002582 [Brevundimonas mediterranea]|jgi:hypothetical protein|uniref:Uncharacterized protein n=1 Tax=Brevundimonas mediterranea TaxID=74329 RepID=A0A7W6A482_9CAUL|nr:hypothetical protein [Brevundimonas mediterranea]